MEYTVLARACRPQIFGQVIGQDHVVTTLRNAIKNNRTAHAYLFSGPRGTGKTTLARIMAKSLNCPDPVDGEPCDQCPSCREIREGISIDVREIDGASNRGIDEIRELKENIRFAPVTSKCKIYIIDEVHMLTKEAFNALLKTLEEPPSHVIFMFATTEIHRVPATILSRCQHFDLRRISTGQIMDSLAAIAEKESIVISRRGLALIARGGGGSLRDAQSLFDQVISYAGTTIEDGEIENILGITDRRYVSGMMSAIIAGKAGECLEILNELYDAGEDIRRFCQTLTRFMMGLLTAGISKSDELLAEFTEDERDELRRQTASVSVATVERLLGMMLSGEEDMRRASDPRIQCEYLLVKMASLEPVIPVDEMINRLETLEARLSRRVSSPPAGEERQVKPVLAPKPPPLQEEPPPPEEPPPQEVVLPPTEAKPEAKELESGGDENDGSLWPLFTERLKRENQILASKLAEAVCLGSEKGILKISVPRGFLFLEQLREPNALALMGRVAADCRDDLREVKIEEADIRDGSNGLPGSPEGKHSLEEIRREALRHPMVQKVIDVFEGAEIRDVKINNGNNREGG